MTRMTLAKVLKIGKSQAIRLPKEFSVRGGEVYLEKVPQGFVVMERDPWEICEEACQKLSDDFMRARAQPRAQKRRLRSTSSASR
jgi:antitoxin VapB